MVGIVGLVCMLLGVIMETGVAKVTAAGAFGRTGVIGISGGC